jgi:hypothetical protein
MSPQFTVRAAILALQVNTRSFCADGAEAFGAGAVRFEVSVQAAIPIIAVNTAKRAMSETFTDSLDLRVSTQSSGDWDSK